VSRGSHSHQVPHMGWPQMAPVASAISVKTMPTGAAALAASAETWWRRMSQISDVISIMNHAFTAMMAAGTWT
jgi:imidazoleglycerol phosphate synthase glutamine amidotransferase subunit HisH